MKYPRALPGEKLDRLCNVIAETGSVPKAAEAVGLPFRRLCRYRARYPLVAARIRQAKEFAYERLEGEAYRRAVLGYDVPVYNKGELIGHYKKYSDVLLIKMLTARVSGYAASDTEDDRQITKIRRVIIKSDDRS